jgi:hypothetical protein
MRSTFSGRRNYATGVTFELRFWVCLRPRGRQFSRCRTAAKKFTSDCAVSRPPLDKNRSLYDHGFENNSVNYCFLDRLFWLAKDLRFSATLLARADEMIE